MMAKTIEKNEPQMQGLPETRPDLAPVERACGTTDVPDERKDFDSWKDMTVRPVAWDGSVGKARLASLKRLKHRLARVRAYRRQSAWFWFLMNLAIVAVCQHAVPTLEMIALVSSPRRTRRAQRALRVGGDVTAAALACGSSSATAATPEEEGWCFLRAVRRDTPTFDRLRQLGPYPRFGQFLRVLEAAPRSDLTAVWYVSVANGMFHFWEPAEVTASRPLGRARGTLASAEAMALHRLQALASVVRPFTHDPVRLVNAAVSGDGEAFGVQLVESAQRVARVVNTALPVDEQLATQGPGDLLFRVVARATEFASSLVLFVVGRVATAQAEVASNVMHDVASVAQVAVEDLTAAVADMQLDYPAHNPPPTPESLQFAPTSDRQIEVDEQGEYMYSDPFDVFDIGGLWEDTREFARTVALSVARFGAFSLVEMSAEGYCYQCLYKTPVNLGPYPTAALVMEDRSSWVSMCHDLEEVFWLSESGGVVHVSKGRHPGAAKHTKHSVMWYLERHPDYTVGGKIDGYCYQAIYPRMDLGPWPRLVDVLRAARNWRLRDPEYVWLTLYGRPMAHIQLMPGTHMTKLAVADIREVLDGATTELAGYNRSWWLQMRVGGLETSLAHWLLGVPGVGLPFLAAITILSPLTAILAIMVMILGRACRGWRTPSVAFVTFGSLGDRLPLQFYAARLAECGFPVVWRHALNDMEGRHVLKQLETGQLFTMASTLAKLAKTLKQCAEDVVVAPLGGLGFDDDKLTYALQAPPHTYRRFNVLPGSGPLVSLVNTVADWIIWLSPPDVRIATYKGCAPRGLGADQLVKMQPNLGERETIVALGSSSCHEPEDLTPETTWSTRPVSFYRYEPDHNHQRMFRKYRKAITHGGAGTVQTARACGCEVTSVSGMIDRDICDNSGFDTKPRFEYFLTPLFLKMGLFTSLLHVRKLGWSFGFRPVITSLYVAFTVRASLASLRGWAIVFSLRSVIGNALSSPTVFGILLQLCSGERSNPFWSITCATVIFVAMRYQSQILGPRGDNSGTKFGIWVIMRAFTSPMSIFLEPWLGFAPSVALTGLVLRLMDAGYYQVIGKLLDLADCLSKPWEDDKTTLNLVATQLHLAPLGPLMCHWEFEDPVTQAVIGVSTEGTRLKAYTSDSIAGERLWTLNTRIPREQMMPILARLRKCDGLPYMPFLNCQTLLLPSLDLQMIVLTSFVVLFSSLMIGTLGVMAGLAMGAWYFGLLGWDKAKLLLDNVAFAGIPFSQTHPHREPKVELMKLTDFQSRCIQAKVLKALAKATFIHKRQHHVTIGLTEGTESATAELTFDSALIEDDVNRFALPFGKQAILSACQGLAYRCPITLMIEGEMTGPYWKTPTESIVWTRDGKAVGISVVSTMPITKQLDVSALKDHTTEFLQAALVFAKRMAPAGSPQKYLIHSFLENSRRFCDRLLQLEKEALGDQVDVAAVFREWPLLIKIDKFLDIFSPDERRPKPVWAPVLERVATPRSEALGIVTVPGHFKALGFHETLAYYMAHMNADRRKGPPLAIKEFVRRVNHCPYVDVTLQKKFSHHDTPQGVDGMLVACREVMVATLERYVGSNTVLSLTDKQQDEIADAVVRSAPELYLNARLASPRQLLNHWMKHKTYSAGVPFMGAGIRTRRDVQKAGWFPALEALATLPLREGIWLPSIAHVFPKSQVVELAKLQKDPSKLRSVTATSIFSNLQKGVLNFDVNNRHNWQAAPGKPGIPLTGAHMGKIFEALDGYKLKFSADITKMDSSLPDVVFKVQAKIRKMGYRDHPLSEVLDSHIDAMMQHTQNGFLINLISEPLESLRPKLDEYHKAMFDSIPEAGWNTMMAAMQKVTPEYSAITPGGVVKKEKGGYTGDSDTTWTNTVGLQIMLFAVISDMYQIPANRLLDHIYLANLGDDNVLGINIDGFDASAVQARFKQMFNIDLRFEGEGGVLDQSFLGKVPRPGVEFEEEFRRNGLRTPRYAVLHDSAKLLMRYTSFKTDSLRYFKKNRRSGDTRQKYLVEKGLGYLSLTAHQRDLYGKLRAQIAEDRAKIKSESLRKRLKIPDYDTVIKQWYKDRTVGHSPLVQLQIREGLAARCEQGMLNVLRSIEQVSYELPVELFGLESEAVMSVDLGKASDYIFEDHTWHGLARRTGIEPTLEDLDLALRQTPYYVFTSARNYIRDIAPGNAVSGPTFEFNRQVAQQRVFLYSALYLATNKLVSLLSFLPMGNIAIGLFNAYTRSLPRLYQFANYAYYLDTGSSSATISRLIPKDVFYNHKAIALTVMHMIPRGLTSLPLGLAPIFSLGRHVFEQVSRLMTVTIGAPRKAMTKGDVDVPQAWLDATATACDILSRGKSPIIVAPTGTGKTRWFPRALIGEEINGEYIERVIVLMPRKILCEQVSGSYYHKKRGAQWPDAGLVTCTYGHFAACHMGGGLSFDRSTVVILDECHEKSPEVLYVRQVVAASMSSVLMTATPTDEDPRYTEIVSVDLKSPYEVACYEAHGYNPVEAFMAFVGPEDRALIIEPRKRQCDSICRTLVNQGVNCCVVNSSQRVVPEDKRVHIVATSIVDAGINIDGITVVIDTGLTQINIRGDQVAVNANSVTSIQRKGRTGRFCKGRYYRLSPIGSNAPKPAASIDQVLSDSPLAKVAPVRNDLRVAPERQQLMNNKHARMRLRLPKKLDASVSIYHYLVLTTREPCAIYKRFASGVLEDSTEFITQQFGVLPEDLSPIGEVLETLKRSPVEYNIGSGWQKLTPFVSNGRVCLGGNPAIPAYHLVKTWYRDERGITPFTL